MPLKLVALRSWARRSVNSFGTAEFAVAVAIIVTAFLVCSQDWLLTKRLALRPGDGPDRHIVYSYGDKSNGGTSTAASGKQPWSWTCFLTRSYEFPYCGFGFLLTSRMDRGIDLSSYDTLRLVIDHYGPAGQIRVQLKNHDQRYSRAGIPDSDKYDALDTTVLGGAQTLKLSLADFTVPDWWKAQTSLPPRLLKPEFNDVVAFELQDGLSGRPGMYVTQIKEVAFEKRLLTSNQLYALLALCWVLLLGGILWRHRLEANRRRAFEAQQLRWASEHDALTGLPNRRGFRPALEAAASRWGREGLRFALVLVDLDHFKHVNDSFGHSAGDDLLRIMAERLRASVRSQDFVARIGGDEFAIILDGIDGEADVRLRAAQVLAKLLQPAVLGRRGVEPGASIGAAIFPLHAGNADDLFKAADTALYALKAEGRGGTKLFNQLMLVDAERAAAQLRAASAAITAKTIVPHYQPKVDLATGKVIGFEALLRSSRRSGVDLPDSMQGAFDDYELASRIGELMQSQVFEHASSWVRDGLDVGTISINAAPAEFLRGDYAERLIGLIGAHEIAPAMIEVEVTEHVFLGRCSDHVTRALTTLRSAGIRISLDDFGTGYSSLAHLRDLAIDSVKIDTSFTRNITSDSRTASIVSAIVALVRSLDLTAVAEGVETSAQADLLRSFGCHHAQGFLFGPPISSCEVRRLLNNESLAA